MPTHARSLISQYSARRASRAAIDMLSLTASDVGAGTACRRDRCPLARSNPVQLSQRLQNLPPYHFAEYARMIAAKRAAGVDVISLSMGDPDLPTPPEVLDALDAAARDPVNQR